MIKIEKAHNKQKKYYNKEFKELYTYQLENWRRSYIDRIFRYIDIWEVEGEEYYLDIGIGGSGYTVIEAAKLGYKAIGIDCSIEGVKKANKFAQDECRTNKAEFIASYAEQLPFKDNLFSKISMIAVLEHIPDDRAAMLEIHRVLKPGGYVYIVVPNAYSRMNPIFILPYIIHDKKVGHLRHYSMVALVNKFKNEGFEFVDGFYSGHCIKLVQRLIPEVKDANSFFSRIWWFLEKIDKKMKNIPSGANINAVFRKL